MVVNQNFLSLNVRGLRASNKRREVFRWLKRFHNGQKSIILLQETHSILGDENQWQKEWGSRICFSHGSYNQRGVAILLPSDCDFEICNIISDSEGRKLCLELKFDNELFCIQNIYAPTQDHVDEQLQFFKSLKNDIEENQDKNLIIGGDFNLYMTRLDKDDMVYKPNKSCDLLTSYMDDYNISDIWRTLNPDIKRYTWRRCHPIIQSRLDYWLVSSELIYNVQSCDIKPSIKTDHSLITLKLISNQESHRGRGLWKFNTSLLADKHFVNHITNQIQDLKEQHKSIENSSLKWELIKMSLRHACIDFSKEKAKITHKIENDLRKKLETLNKELDVTSDNEVLIRFNETKAELERINAIKTEGYKIRSKAEIIEQDEKGTKYFLNLEKRNAKLKNITKLQVETGAIITDSDRILKEQGKFYKKLYTPAEAEPDFEHLYLNENIPKITKASKEQCDLPITLEECKKALNNMKINKTPGTDGFPVEFYRYFWEELGPLIHESFLYAFNNNILSSEQRRAVLRLIPKKDKNITQLKNWRPISLLNTDYKLLTHVLANRIQEVLSDIISKDQSGYLKGRYIGLNIRTIIDIISNVEENNDSALLTFLDFEKAFDKINWTFMFKTIDKFGFGVNFQKWVKILYTDIESCVINNGVTSKYFHPKCGIRQGCPLSALLFILCVETLTIAIKHNSNIKGVKVHKFEYKCTQLADDTTLFLKDVNSLRIALNMMYMFQKTSGLKLNVSKTEILQVGIPLIHERTPFNLIWDKSEIYALGTWFYKDNNHAVYKNLSEKLTNFENLLTQWTKRHLTWLGKITVLKSLGLSKLNYMISNLETPKWFTDRVKDLAYDFLWDGKPPRIKNSVIVNEIEYGGLRMPQIDNYIMSQKVSWIKRLLANQETAPCQYLMQMLPDMKFSDFLKSSFDPRHIPDYIPEFYRQILFAWFDLKQAPKSIIDVQREVIWCSTHIKIDDKYILESKLYKAGIVFINDIIKENGSFLSHHEICQKTKTNISQLYYMSLIDAIPSEWRKMLKSQRVIPMQPHMEDVFININKQIKPIAIQSSRAIYWHFMSKNIVHPTCIKNWSEKYKIEFPDLIWKKIFSLPHSITQHTKLREFQYKIIHRTYASDSLVGNFDASVSKLCSKCNVKNSIIHLFAECQQVEDIWQNLCSWYSTLYEDMIALSTTDIIFGVTQNRAPRALNFCILHLKWFIHVKKLRQEVPIFREFLLYLKSTLNVEKYLSVQKSDHVKFEKELGRMATALKHM